MLYIEPQVYTMNTIISVNWIWKEKYKNYFPVPFLLANRINWNELRRWKNSLSKVLHLFLSWFKKRFWEQNKKLYLTLIAYATDLHFVRHDSIFFCFSFVIKRHYNLNLLWYFMFGYYWNETFLRFSIAVLFHSYSFWMNNRVKYNRIQISMYRFTRNMSW